MDVAPQVLIDEKTQAVLSRGDAASRVLDDPDLTAAHELLKADLHSQWEGCHAPGIRENIWQRLNGLNALRGQLMEYAADAKHTRAKLAAEEQKRQRDLTRRRPFSVVA